MPQIRVSPQVKENLTKIQKRNGHTSMDSALRFLLTIEEGKICKGERCIWFWNCVKFGCQKFEEKKTDA